MKGFKLARSAHLAHSCVMQHQPCVQELTLWNEEGLACNHSCIDEPASSSSSSVCILLNETKELLPCTDTSHRLLDAAATG